MSKFIEFKFCELPDTPYGFNKTLFEAGDPAQIKLYKDSKVPRRKKKLTYTEVTDEDKIKNYARVVPENGMFLDFDNPKEAEEMYDIITHSGLRCLILETTKGYHFLFRVPDFYKKEITCATNWFGYKFDTKATTDIAEAVQIIRVCGMNRKEVCSWNLDTPIKLKELDIEKLDVLPYWLWGKKDVKELHKGGKPGESEYILTDTPFTQLMVMKEGGRHNHIVEKCSYFALSNGFEMDEFKNLITAIHDQYLAKIGTPMPESDLFGDLDTRWEDYKATLESSGWVYEEKERKWEKLKTKAKEKIDERRAAEYLFKKFDFYGNNKKLDGTFEGLLYKEIGGSYEYNRDITVFREALREYSDQNFKKEFFKEVEVQLMQMCATNNKIITRNDKYIIVKNKVLSCVAPEAYDFSWIGSRPPTDVVLPWNWYPEEWVEEHEDDLGGNITRFIKQLSRDTSGKPQPEIEQWLWVIAGASMVPANLFQKIAILSGGGQNGKSLYTSLIKLCLGADMFNESKIFDNSNDSFWGQDLDKGISCIVDDIPKTYNKNAMTNLKGAITGTDSVEINEKFKAKRKLDVLPQIIACTNFEFELYDKSEGMQRRVIILPTEFHVDDSVKDTDLQYKLVLNTMNPVKVAEYRMSEDAFNYKGKKIMHMYTGEKGVLDSLDHGSLAWFANKARYMYLKWAMKELKPEYTPKMKSLLKQAFDDSPKGQCDELINWYLTSTCGGTDASKFDLSQANCFSYEFPNIYKEFCKKYGFKEMKDTKFKNNLGRVIKERGFKVTREKDTKKGNLVYDFIHFDELDNSKK